jgi:periplasmic protein TonB
MFENTLLDQNDPRGALSFSGSLILQSTLLLGALGLGLLLPVALPEVPEIHVPPPAPRFRDAMRILSTTIERSVIASPVRPRFTYTPPTANASLSASSSKSMEDMLIGLPTLEGSPRNYVDGTVGGFDFSKASPPPAAKPKQVEAPKPESAARLTVGGNVLASKLIFKVQPVYPELARRARIEGVVQLHGVISRDGQISQLRVLSGHPLLVKAAFDAVSQWRYSPTLLNQVAVEVEAPIEVRFTLGR